MEFIHVVRRIVYGPEPETWLQWVLKKTPWAPEPEPSFFDGVLCSLETFRLAGWMLMQAVWSLVFGNGLVSVLGFSTMLLVMWNVYTYGLFGRLVRLVGLVVPGVAWVLRWFKKPEIVLAPLPSPITSPESIREGSHETAFSWPKAQLLVCFRNAKGEFAAVGNAVRWGKYLIGPDHVFATAASGPKYLVKFGDSSKFHPLPEVKELDTDLMYAVVHDDVWSKLGVASTTIGVLEQANNFGSIVGCRGMGSYGTIRHDKMAFGMITYTGTTMNGYSGGLYRHNNQGVGIHTQGGTVNGGWSLAYARMRILFAEKIVQEETPEYLKKQYDSGQKMRVRNSYDPGFLEVGINGNYISVSVRDFDRAFGSVDWRDDLQDGWLLPPTHGKRRDQYDDGGYEGYDRKDSRRRHREADDQGAVVSESIPMDDPLAGESNSSNQQPGGSSKSASVDDSIKPGILHLMDIYMKLPKELQDSLTTSAATMILQHKASRTRGKKKSTMSGTLLSNTQNTTD
uniref:RNA-dependent RNA polymerase n=1 Tax=Grapevine-associated sobemo-like virus 1 TaxID=2814415 RepID=A0A8F5MLF4_9VIRU|nr:MAG: RNA-dependent RNA polymerase [Grapevine-associated sobemo-like virus 1]